MTTNNSNKKIIAIQGGQGSFHEIACREYFGNNNIEIVACDNFPDLCEACNNGDVKYGIMAIENTVSGSLVFNYSLLREYKLNICGEIYLRVKQNLLALPGQTISDIKEVRTHYMAIAQTRLFFRKYPAIRIVESSDTALSASEIRENELKGIGAVASTLAAELFDLSILKEGIETNKKNFTRFLVLNNESSTVIPGPDNINKSSIVFTLPHSQGSLSKVLSILSFYELNLSKIQSLPIIGKEWEYLFYVDLIFDDYNRFRQAIEAIKPLTIELKILGEYKKGKRKV